MYVFLVIVLLVVWYIAPFDAQRLQQITCNSAHHMTDLIHYGQSKDKGECLADLLQMTVVLIISGMNAMRLSSYIERLFIFCVTFIVCTWCIKFMVEALNWIQTYGKMLTLNGVFAICAPLIILCHMSRMISVFEIRLTFMTLLLSIGVVYGEIIHIVTGKKLHLNKSVQIKSILTWFGIILMNLYTLIVFVQFYMNAKAHHFIEAEQVTKEAMVDLFYYLIVTFTTLGFGDIKPGTSLGKMITCLIAISGMLFTGLFMGAILSTNEKR